MTKYRKALKPPRKNGVDYPHDKTARQCTQCDKIFPTDEMFYYIRKKQRYFSHCKKCHIAAQHKKTSQKSAEESYRSQRDLNGVPEQTVIVIGPSEEQEAMRCLLIADLRPNGFAL